MQQNTEFPDPTGTPTPTPPVTPPVVTPTPTPFPVVLNLNNQDVDTGSLFWDSSYTLSWNVVEADSCNLSKMGTAAPVASGKSGNYPAVLKQNEVYQLDCLRGTELKSDVVMVLVNVPATQMIFSTAGQFNGNLGGLSGADLKCQMEADAAQAANTLPTGVRNRKWVAILSSSVIDARDRVKQFVAIQNTAGTTVFAANPNQLFVATNPAPHALQFNASTAANAVNDQEDNVWTGSTVTGTKRPAGGNYCSDWNNNSNTTAGIGDVDNNSWMNHTDNTNGAANCQAAQNRLLCINH